MSDENNEEIVTEEPIVEEIIEITQEQITAAKGILVKAKDEIIAKANAIMPTEEEIVFALEVLKRKDDADLLLKEADEIGVFDPIIDEPEIEEPIIDEPE